MKNRRIEKKTDGREEKKNLITIRSQCHRIGNSTRQVRIRSISLELYSHFDLFVFAAAAAH